MKYLLLVVVLFVSCKKEDRSLEAFYMNEGVVIIKRIHCNELDRYSVRRRVNYLETENEEFIEKFASSYDKLLPKGSSDGHDVRIKLLYHDGSKTDTICMGEFFGISVNGQQMTDSPELLKLVKNKIYK